MRLKPLFLKLHLYLGLVTGLVVAVVCFTGAMLVFEEEIVRALHPERYEVAASGERMPLGDAVARLRAKHPELAVSGATVHADPTRPYEISAGRARAFVDPYTGRVIASGVTRPAFFQKNFELHRWLLADDTGKLVVGVSTLAFLVIIVSGVVIWWPRNRRQLRTRTSLGPLLRRGTSAKRRNYDLHVVLGIFSAPVLFVLAFTGLAWSFTWFNDGIYKVTRSAKAPPPPESVGSPADGELTLQRAYETALATMGPAQYHTVRMAGDSTAPVTVTALAVDAPHNRATDALHLDRWTGATLRHDRWETASLGVRVRRTFYPVHVGAIGGMPTRVLAFVACLLGASFPITGFLIWLPKWRRERETKRALATARRAVADTGGARRRAVDPAA